MSLRLYLLLMTYNALKLSVSQKHNDTLLSCYICMDLDDTVKQECDEDRPMFQTCVFTKDLVNWKHVKGKLDSEVTFKCLLLYYKDLRKQDIQSHRGCVAEYKDYFVCDRLSEVLKYDEEISCTLCETHNCNAGLNFDEDENTSADNYSYLYLIVLPLVSFYQIFN